MSSHTITVILDTNVFVAGYWAPRSASAELIAACLNGQLQAQYSEAIRQEVMHILLQIRLPEWYVRQTEQFWQRAQKVEPVQVTIRVKDDPDDQKFLEAAVGGETDFLITNDVHLLKIGYINRTEILTPSSATSVLPVTEHPGG